MDVTAFDAVLMLSELKESLELVTGGHVMADTAAFMADFTGERF
jgi:hypothetical protein